jgi:hypothetical protein
MADIGSVLFEELNVKKELAGLDAVTLEASSPAMAT